MSASASTRQRLITAAEALFAAHGIHAVSLRELTRASGARNATALQYHFGDRDGLVRALLDKHAAETDARRHALLDAYETGGDAELRALAAALVLPLAAKLEDADGRNYLRILAELISRPDVRVHVEDYDEEHNSLLRWRTLLEPLLDPDAIRFHRRFVALRFAILELARRAGSDGPADNRLFASHLIDLVTALLSAPLSPQSRRIAAGRTPGAGGSA